MTIGTTGCANSILVDSCADVLMFGMGERTILQLVDLLEKGVRPEAIRCLGPAS